MTTMTTHVDRRPAIWGGVIFGLVIGGIFLASSGGQVWAAVGVAILAGGLFGLAVDYNLHRQRRAAVAALGPAGETLNRSDVHDALSGPVAKDPSARQQQLKIVDLQIAEAGRAGRRTIIVFGLLLFAEVVLAITSTPWFWVAAALFAVLLVATPIQQARLRRRRAELAAAV
ncbi:hypothetical protein FDO65_21685 [Nakamurella flava]|uniref:Uncharacterized protein n=1 Tax=Nakamurella flava TaxID=2576308 RepID=A0A4U6Q6N4_9ACTN|nr:hypothetical protein [Nakamurella flava]TKV55959.1 hypothetical protein FDO65_21685 [Nakamurella flava]